jgi:hypothetical protein
VKRVTPLVRKSTPHHAVKVAPSAQSTEKSAAMRAVDSPGLSMKLCRR